MYGSNKCNWKSNVKEPKTESVKESLEEGNWHRDCEVNKKELGKYCEETMNRNLLH